MFCACQIRQLFSVASCVVRVTHKVDFRIVANKKRQKWRPVYVKELRHAATDIHVFGKVCGLPPGPS